jgi:hypothetical protein
MDMPGPKMTAFHIMMLSGHGLPEIPPGGSVERRLKSRIRRRRQFVDYITHNSDNIHRKNIEMTYHGEFQMDAQDKINGTLDNAARIWCVAESGYLEMEGETEEYLKDRNA